MKYLTLIFTAIFLFTGCERPTEISQDDDGIPPSVPEGLRIYYAADAEIVIDWIQNPQMDVKGYNIYRRTENTELEPIGFTAYEYFNDKYLEYDTLYYYAVSALDFSGLESSLTNEVSARPLNKYKPVIPSGISVNARNWEGKKSVYLRWMPNEEYDILGYKIFRSDTTAFTADSGKLIGFTAAGEFEDTNATDYYKEYSYRIIAVDKGNLESNPSNIVSDKLLDFPVLILPGNNASVSNFTNFIFLSTGAQAVYKIIIQNNIYFGEIWQTEFSSSLIFDTIKVKVPAGVFEYNKTYYWRVAAFTKSEQPNSFSPLYSFTIKP